MAKSFPVARSPANQTRHGISSGTSLLRRSILNGNRRHVGFPDDVRIVLPLHFLRLCRRSVMNQLLRSRPGRRDVARPTWSPTSSRAAGVQKYDGWTNVGRQSAKWTQFRCTRKGKDTTHFRVLLLLARVQLVSWRGPTDPCLRDNQVHGRPSMQ